MFNTFEIFLICIGSLYIIQDFIFFYIINSISENSDSRNGNLDISVIIASKNEAQNLNVNLPSILKQSHKNFEVVLVDDQSTDDTLQIIQHFQKTYPHLKYFKIDPDQKSSKKNALSLGIENAENEHLVFTDADCKPLTNEWLSELQKYFKTNNSVVLGYSPYKKEKGWLNKIIRMETFQTAVSYMGMASIGEAYMGVGRNLAYSKTVFRASGKFNAHKEIKSGDDDLFINEAAGKYPIYCCLNPKTFVESKPKETLKTWIEQKRRHMTTAPHYKLKHQLWLGFQFILKFIFWFTIIPLSLILLFLGQYYLITYMLSILIIRLLISKSVFNKLMMKDLWLQSILLEFQLIGLQLYIFSLNLISPKRDW